MLGGTLSSRHPFTEQEVAHMMRFSAAGANDFLQAAFAALSNKANELEERPA